MRRGLAVVVVAAGLWAPAHGRDLFTATLSTEGETGNISTTELLDFARFFTDEGLRRVVSSYTETSAATANFNFRGLPGTLSYPVNSTALTLAIPLAGVNETFQGATRDESQRLLEEWFRGRGASRVRDVLRAAVAHTTADPVAGNPTSLMSQMAMADFNMALTPLEARGFGVGLRIGSFSGQDFDANSYTLPLNYTFTTTGGDQVLLDLPLTMVDTEGSYAYQGSFGAGYRFALTRDRSWTILPMLRVGSVGSVDIGSVATIISGSVASVYTHRFESGPRLTIGNMIGHARTVPFNYGGYELDYRLQNTVLRNGIVGFWPVGTFFGGVPVEIGAFLTDTRFFGDRQRVNNYQEIGLTLGVREVFGRALSSPAEIGITFLTGAGGYRGFTFNTGVRF